MTLENILYLALGIFISELLHAIFDQGYLKRIALAQERFVKWAENKESGE